MTTELVPVPVAHPPPLVLAARPLVEAWLDGRSPCTARAYAADLAHFAAFLELPGAGPAAAVEWFLAFDGGNANAIALRYRNAMVASNLAAATVNRRLAALRSVVKLGRTLGRVAWAIEIGNVKAEARRDARGPDAAGWRKVWKAAVARGDGPGAVRDRAILATLFDLALRRAELVALDLDDVDLAAGYVRVIGKGKREKERITLPDPTRKALAEWVAARGPAPGPLFHRLDRAADSSHNGPGLSHDTTPLTGRAVADLVNRVGREAGLDRTLRPHGLRHSAITAALDSGADVREVRRYSRHAKLETIIRYDDNRTDMAGRIARKVAGKR